MKKPISEISSAQRREERLKAALKSNIARRKGQAKARQAGCCDAPEEQKVDQDVK